MTSKKVVGFELAVGARRSSVSGTSSSPLYSLWLSFVRLMPCAPRAVEVENRKLSCVPSSTNHLRWRHGANEHCNIIRELCHRIVGRHDCILHEKAFVHHLTRCSFLSKSPIIAIARSPLTGTASGCRHDFRSSGMVPEAVRGSMDLHYAGLTGDARYQTL